MGDFVRDRFGLTQERLASWLGVNRVVVAQAESGQRHLPLSSGLQELRLALATMGMIHPDRATQDSALLPLPLPPPEAAPLAHRLADCRHHALRLCQPGEKPRP